MSDFPLHKLLSHKRLHERIVHITAQVSFEQSIYFQTELHLSITVKMWCKHILCVCAWCDVIVQNKYEKLAKCFACYILPKLWNKPWKIVSAEKKLQLLKRSYNFFWNGFCSLPSAWKNYRFVKCSVDIIVCTSVNPPGNQSHKSVHRTQCKR